MDVSSILSMGADVASGGILGIVFGGVSRLFQYWMENKDKQAERDHEFRMYEKHSEFIKIEQENERQLKNMDFRAQVEDNSFELLKESISAQTSVAKAAGGFVLKLSASVRPVLSYWLLLLYTAAKALTLWLVYKSTSELGGLAGIIFNTFDAAILGSVITYWLGDRSITKPKRF